MTTRIREIDLRDDTDLRAWWEVGAAASAERPFDAWPAWEVSRATLPRPRTDQRLVPVLAVDVGDQVVGSGMLTLYLQDNHHLAGVAVDVVPAARRRGVGSLLLADLERRAGDAGRTTVVASAHAPVGEESPGSCFAAARGYPVASAEETKLVDLTTAAPTWSALDDQVAARIAGYGIEVVDGGTPEHRVDDVCRLFDRFVEQIPTGDLDLRPEVWTPRRLREGEDRARATGGVTVTAYAVTPDDRLCGFSDVRVHPLAPGLAAVGGTLVLPEHRGHALGLAMKLAGHRRLMELFPGCGAVETGNAGVNAPMNAVNTAMGYRVVERCLDVQRVL